MRSEIRDTSYLLGAELRSQLATHFDADSLERLLQWLPPERRSGFLSMFLPSQKDGSLSKTAVKATEGAATSPDIHILTHVGDPIIQDLLDKVWQPYWDQYSDSDLARTDETIPGLALARKRRSELNATRGKRT